MHITGRLCDVLFSADELADRKTLGNCTFDGNNGKIELPLTKKAR